MFKKQSNYYLFSASPGYSSGSLDTATTSSYPYTATEASLPRKPLERDVDEHNRVTSSPAFDKASVDFAIPTKENEESRLYPNYNSGGKSTGYASYAPTKESVYFNPYGDSMMGEL